MAESLKLGSSEWFKGLAESLINAGLGAVTNALTPRSTAAAPASSTAKSSGGFSAIFGGMAWLPYLIAGAFVLVIVLVIRKR